MIYKEYKQITINTNTGTNEVDSCLLSYLKEGWEIVSTWTTRYVNNKNEYDKNGSYVIVYEDQYYLTHFIIGRNPLAETLYA